VQSDDPDAISPAAGRAQPKDRMTVLLPTAVRRRLRVAAAIQDRDISDVIGQAVQLYLDDWEGQRAARGLPPLPLE
jgi:hypothetical protein